MTLSIFPKNTLRIASPFLAGLFLVMPQHPFDCAHGKAASRRDSASVRHAQTTAKTKPSGQSTRQKLANPLNDLLDEAQRDIDEHRFEAAITPLQKVLAEEPNFAYGHFQLRSEEHTSELQSL